MKDIHRLCLPEVAGLFVDRFRRLCVGVELICETVSEEVYTDFFLKSVLGGSSLKG
jgi:hypothetical protein